MKILEDDAKIRQKTYTLIAENLIKFYEILWNKIIRKMPTFN